MRTGASTSDQHWPYSLTRRDEGVKLAIVTASEDEGELFQAIKSGTQGYLLKNLTAAEFFSLARDERALSPSMARQLLSEVSPAVRDGGLGSISSEPLTGREQEVLQLLVQGVTTTRALARQLLVTDNTIKFHLRNILDKLHLHNRAEVVAYASRNPLDPLLGHWLSPVPAACGVRVAIFTIGVGEGGTVEGG